MNTRTIRSSNMIRSNGTPVSLSEGSAAWLYAGRALAAWRDLDLDRAATAARLGAQQAPSGSVAREVLMALRGRCATSGSPKGFAPTWRTTAERLTQALASIPAPDVSYRFFADPVGHQVSRVLADGRLESACGRCFPDDDVMMADPTMRSCGQCKHHVREPGFAVPTVC